MKKNSDYKGPLAGLNVIDFGHYYAGPIVGMMLADQGANVIRIMKPGKPELFDQQFRLLNRNKKLLTLDLKTDEGKKQAQSLVANADVVIENFRPGVMKRFGLDYAAVKQANPGLVYLSLPGFSSKDTERAHIQAWEGVIAAASGIFTEAHGTRQKLGFPPLYASIPLSSAYGSMYGAIAVMAALSSRGEDGQGTVIEVPLVEAGLSAIVDKYRMKADPNHVGTLADRLKPYVYSPEDDGETQYQKLKGSQGVSPWLYKSSDDRDILVFTVKPKFAERAFKVLGIYDQLREEGFIMEDPWKGRKGNNLADMLNLSPKTQQRIREMMGPILRTKTADEWDAFFAKIGVPYTYIRNRDEWLTLDPLLKSGVLTKMNNGTSEITVPGRVADMSGAGGVLHSSDPKEPAAVSVDEAVELIRPTGTLNGKSGRPGQKKKGDLLKGVKVLDLCSIVAGPTGAYSLAQYGADVIRIEPPENFNLPLHLIDMLEVNQGKRSMVLDIKAIPGREIFNKLVAEADIILHNRLDDMSKRLGVHVEQLQAINPKAVVCQMSALGGTWRDAGGWENRVGYDPIANMPSGLLAHYGSMEYPQYFGGISADLMGGFSVAFAALVGVYQRQQTGVAGEGRASLARATTFNQLVWMIHENGSSDWGEETGQLTFGPSWWQQIYPCADERWIYVEVEEGRKAELAQAVLGADSGDTESMKATFQKQPSNHWLKMLDAAGIACHAVISAEDIYNGTDIRPVDNEASDETAGARLEIFRWDDHPSGRPMLLPSMSWVRVGEEHSYLRTTPTPKVGTHTKEILAELGCDDDEIAELMRLRVAHEFIPAIGSKDKYFFEDVTPELRGW